MLRKPNKRVQAIATYVVIAFVFAAAYLLYFPAKVGDDDPIKFKIQKGDSLNAVAQNLKNEGLIYNKTLFVLYVSALNKENSLKVGTYTLSRSINPTRIAHILIGGFADSNDIQILLAEGFNIWEMDKRLADYGISEENYFSTKYLNDEGYLFPDTYRISRPEEDSFDLKLVADEVHSKMQETFNERTAEIFASLSYEKQKETIVLASMLEKEARGERDMRLVSGIIQKRLKADRLLQIDATVSYGACLRIFKETKKNCDVTQIGVGREIKIDSPYNSYMRKGLPPGPISNPGERSIKAALNPLESPYWYYLSTRDTGQIIYSATGAEHEANRRKYLGI